MEKPDNKYDNSIPNEVFLKKRILMKNNKMCIIKGHLNECKLETIEIKIVRESCSKN